MLRTFDLATVPATRWKNGGGITHELACWPEGSDTSRFDWRVSVAAIAASGPFSRFPGIDRMIMLLDGAGVRLRSHDGRIDHALTTPYEPLAFAGEIDIDCVVGGSASRDFNVMTRRRAFVATMSILRAPASLPASEHGLVFAPFGTWTCQSDLQRRIATGCGIWWAEESHCFSLTPTTETSSLIAVQFSRP
jgi:environmental stress-induced protein Ves